MALSKSYKFISLLMVLVLCFSFVVPQPEANAELVATGIALGAATIVAIAGYGLIPVMNGYSLSDANLYWEGQFSSWANSHGHDIASILADITFANNILTFGSSSAEVFNSFTSDFALSNDLGPSSSIFFSGNFPYTTYPNLASNTGYRFPSGNIPISYSSVTLGSNTYHWTLEGSNAYIRNQNNSSMLTDSGYGSTAYPVGIIFTSDSSGNIFMRIMDYYSSSGTYGYTNSKYVSVNQYKGEHSISGSLSPSFSSNISQPASSFRVPSGLISDSGILDISSPYIGDITIEGDSPPGGDGDDEDDTLLGYVHDIAVSLGITGGLYGVVSQVSSAVSNISDYVSDIYDSVSDAITSFGETVGDIADSVSSLFEEAFEWFHDTWSDFLEWLQQLIQDIIDAINAGILDITDAISLVISNIQAFGLDIVEAIEGLAPASVPDTVLPVPDDFEGIDSDFDLNLPSIWHYVTSWLACIAPFVSVMQSVWAVLPTCIVAPVYAAIVLIIVLGLLHKVIHL